MDISVLFLCRVLFGFRLGGAFEVCANPRPSGDGPGTAVGDFFSARIQAIHF